MPACSNIRACVSSGRISSTRGVAAFTCSQGRCIGAVERWSIKALPAAVATKQSSG